MISAQAIGFHVWNNNPSFIPALGFGGSCGGLKKQIPCYVSLQEGSLILIFLSNIRVSDLFLTCGWRGSESVTKHYGVLFLTGHWLGGKPDVTRNNLVEKLHWWGTEVSHQQSQRNWCLSQQPLNQVGKRNFQPHISLQMTPHQPAPWLRHHERHWARTIHLSCSQTPDPLKLCEIFSICYFKLLPFTDLGSNSDM